MILLLTSGAVGDEGRALAGPGWHGPQDSRRGLPSGAPGFVAAPTGFQGTHALEGRSGQLESGPAAPRAGRGFGAGRGRALKGAHVTLWLYPSEVAFYADCLDECRKQGLEVVRFIWCSIWI